MIQKQSWEITDEFWEEVKNLLPEKQRDPNKEYKRAAGAGRKPMESRKIYLHLSLINSILSTFNTS